MKKFSLIIMTVFIATCGFAQQHHGGDQQHKGQGKGEQGKKVHKTPEQRAEGATQRWTKALTLTAEQQPKVKQIFLDRATKVDAIKAKYANNTDKKAMHEEIKAVKTEADNSMKEVLTPQQYDQYIKIKEEKKQQKQQKKQQQKQQSKPAPGSHDDTDEDDED